MVSVLAPLPGAMNAPEPLPLPTVTAPEIMPPPPSVPASTSTAPVPVAGSDGVIYFKETFTDRLAPGVKARTAESECSGTDFLKLATAVTSNTPVADYS